MGKNKNKSSQQQYLKTDIDYDKLAEAIVRANEIYAEKATKKEISSQKENHDNWLKLMHIDAKKQPKKFFQQVWLILRFPFISKKKMVSNRATYALEMFAIVGVLKLLQILFGIIGLSSLCAVFNFFKFENWTIGNLMALPVLLVSWMIYGLLRMSVVEIDRIRDHQLLLTILSAITSFVAMVIAIVALFV